MKTMVTGWIAAFAAVVAVSAFAQDAAELARTKRCTTCHAMDKEKVGPPFKQVATKYKGNANAKAALVAKLRAGKEHPEVKATDAELSTLVDYVLSSGK
jgi:cytochrome c